ncbi:MAG: CBS domain-containing protein [Pirellulales bacterium]
MELLDLCHHEPVCGSPQEPLSAIVQRMHEQNVGAVVIVDDRRRVVGLITDRDVALALGRQRANTATPAAEVMSTEVKTIWADQGIFNATQYLLGHQVRRLPVVNRQDELVGLISVDDLLGLLARELFNVARALEPSLGQHI